MQAEPDCVLYLRFVVLFTEICVFFSCISQIVNMLVDCILVNFLVMLGYTNKIKKPTHCVWLLSFDA